MVGNFVHGKLFIHLLISLCCCNVIQSQILKEISCSEGTQLRLSNTTFQLESNLVTSNHYQTNCEVTPNSHTAVLKLSVKALSTQQPIVNGSPFSSRKSNYSQNGEIHLLVVDNNRNILYREDFQNASALTGEDKYIICPGLDYKIAPSFGIITIGNIGHRFVGYLVDYNMTSGESVSVVANKDNMFSLLAFEIGSEYKRQFQVTVKSDEDTPCCLTVSKDCYAVQGDPGNHASITLTLSKYGRITLSTASNPALSSGHWFIGIKPLNKSLPDNWSKKMTVVAEYGYNNQDRPVLYVALLSAFGGLFVAIFAHFILNQQLETLAHDELDHGRGTTSGTVKQEAAPVRERKATDVNSVELDVVDGQINYQEVHDIENKDSEDPAYNPMVTPTASNADADEYISTFYSTSHVNAKSEFIWYPKPKFLLKVFVLRWFKNGEKTFSYTTGIMAISLLVGTMQFLIASWSKMYETGNRDICYYNDACYRPLYNYDIPYNLIISNLAYCLHGVILAFSVGVREAIDLETNTKCDYSITYALAWTLTFEGLFSSFYHLCPSRQTFQFDSAFMFVISGLVVVALFNARAKQQHRLYNHDENNPIPCPKPVIAAKFFLFFICPLLLLNYLGSMRDTTGLPAFGDAVFWIFLFLWIFFIYGWVVYKLQINYWRCNPICEFKWAMMLGLVPILIIVIGILTHKDWSQFFLFSCIAGSGLAIFGDIATKVYERYKAYKQHQNTKEQKAKIGKFLDKAYFNVKVFFRILYCAALGVCWGFAVYYFIFMPVAQKTKTPAYSRTFNTECVFFNYYDPHDLWHILSSFALLMSSYLLIYIT